MIDEDQGPEGTTDQEDTTEKDVETDEQRAKRHERERIEAGERYERERIESGERHDRERKEEQERRDQG